MSSLACSPWSGLQAAQGLHAAPLQQLQQPPTAAAANAPPQLQTLAQLQSLLQFQQIYQASPWQQQQAIPSRGCYVRMWKNDRLLRQMVIQIVCLTQRAEEHVFDKKIEACRRHVAVQGVLGSVSTADVCLRIWYGGHSVELCSHPWPALLAWHPGQRPASREVGHCRAAWWVVIC